MSRFPLAHLQSIGLPCVCLQRPLSDKVSTGHGGNLVSQTSAADFDLALDDALCSALTKFDTLDAQFSNGRSVKDVSNILIEELLADADFTPLVAGSEQQEALRRYVQTHVGKAFGDWKKGNKGTTQAKDAYKRREVPLPWASIDAYPEWVMNQIELYLNAEPGESDAARQYLEHVLLTKPIISGSIKYDGTCFGKLDDGELCGRKDVVGSLCTEYQKTSTASAQSCDAATLKRLLEETLGIAVAQLCVWGELMCNPNFYGYKDRGLDAKWVCFGIVATFHEPDASISHKLKEHSFAHSLNKEGSKVRLMMCPALQDVLRRVGVTHVAQDQFGGLSHAEVVAQGCVELQNGVNEGIIIVFEGSKGQASIRKWKNSAEGASARKTEAQLLTVCHAKCMDRCEHGKLDKRIVDMLDVLRSVAMAETNPVKKGRNKTSQKVV